VGHDDLSKVKTWGNPVQFFARANKSAALCESDYVGEETIIYRILALSFYCLWTDSRLENPF
jgi:hypothetical protein